MNIIFIQSMKQDLEDFHIIEHSDTQKKVADADRLLVLLFRNCMTLKGLSSTVVNIRTYLLYTTYNELA